MELCPCTSSSIAQSAPIFSIVAVATLELSFACSSKTDGDHAPSILPIERHRFPGRDGQHGYRQFIRRFAGCHDSLRHAARHNRRIHCLQNDRAPSAVPLPPNGRSSRGYTHRYGSLLSPVRDRGESSTADITAASAFTRALRRHAKNCERSITMSLAIAEPLAPGSRFSTS